VERRSYGQYCALARALDVVGERWTLLVVRDLIMGPKRFTDLLEGLPGIGRNLLVARLRHLEAVGLVRRAILAPPAASRVYELTDDGRSLAVALGPLTRWGARRLGERTERELFRPGWMAMAMTAGADLEATRGVHAIYQLEVDGEIWHLRVDDGIVEPRAAPADRPDLVIRMDTATLVDIVANATSPIQAAATGRLMIDGPPEAFTQCIAIFAGSQVDALG
jgi:DNA-binding HxlR family transcriptional regulator